MWTPIPGGYRRDPKKISGDTVEATVKQTHSSQDEFVGEVTIVGKLFTTARYPTAFLACCAVNDVIAAMSWYNWRVVVEGAIDVRQC